ncbi:MAG: CocE/NonD family hydrolase [Lentisphaerae bacterium]|nr:CocE/NonD family hydrolase [Lentisphaerota bacterium]
MNPYPKSPVLSERIRVPMRDGVRLSVHVHRPAGAGRVPAILSYTPYRKGPLVPGGCHPIVRHGYATVAFDIRGCGESEGWNDSIYSDAERQDGYDMVEWTAAQPWCDGAVGMWGISFSAAASLQVAMAAPPHLKAVIVYSGTDDQYTEWTNPGGSPRPYMYMGYSPLMTANNFSPPNPAEIGPAWKKIWAERLKKNSPWGLAFMNNILDGPFWRVRSLRGKYDRVRCPVFVVCGWADWYCTPLLRTFAHLTVPKRALIGPWSHQWPDAALPGPRMDWPKEALKWFDHWLKGKDTGVANEPPVTIFIREFTSPSSLILEDKGRFRRESDWPVPRVKTVPHYLLAKGRLGRTHPTGPPGHDRLEFDPRVGTTTGIHGGGPFNDNWAMPLDQRPDEALSLVYSTAPLPRPVEAIGQPRMILHFTATAPVVYFMVKLCDVSPDGTSALVTKGGLNVSHRNSHVKPTPIEPGKPYEVTIDLLACAYRFAKGHRIRVSIAGADFMNAWPTPLPCVSSIFRTSRRPSRLLLPVAPLSNHPLPAPDLGRSAQQEIRRESLEAPEFSISRDIIRNTVTLRYAVAYDPTLSNEATMTVSADNPARAVIDARAQRHCDFPGEDIWVKAHCFTESDARAFHHSVELEITRNGRKHFEKKWKTSQPRTHA